MIAALFCTLVLVAGWPILASEFRLDEKESVVSPVLIVHRIPLVPKMRSKSTLSHDAKVGKKAPVTEFEERDRTMSPLTGTCWRFLVEDELIVFCPNQNVSSLALPRNFKDNSALGVAPVIKTSEEGEMLGIWQGEWLGNRTQLYSTGKSCWDGLKRAHTKESVVVDLECPLGLHVSGEASDKLDGEEVIAMTYTGILEARKEGKCRWILRFRSEEACGLASAAIDASVLTRLALEHHACKKESKELVKIKADAEELQVALTDYFFEVVLPLWEASPTFSEVTWAVLETLFPTELRGIIWGLVSNSMNPTGDNQDVV